MKQPRQTLIVLLVAAGLTLGAKRVQADDFEIPTSVVVASISVLGADVGFSIYDVDRAVEGKRPSTGAAVVEVLLAGGQLALFAPTLRSTQNSGYIGYGIWMTALGLHGVASLLWPHHEVPMPVVRALGGRVTFAPTVVSDGTTTTAGIGAMGRF